jgi:hypothetical protein
VKTVGNDSETPLCTVADSGDNGEQTVENSELNSHRPISPGDW